ncbi:MAG: 8-oxoguanine DNA glycosylase [Clostridiales bacterium]|nr:8-oxoguanine DNA glycosylase [Clostridiales bacterium]
MIIHNENLNIEQIAESGQCFRMNPIEKNTYSLIAYGRYLELKQIDESTVEFRCSEEEFKQLWKEYFDLTFNYKKIVDGLINGSDDFLKKAAEYGRGIRILKQEPFEALISFIISQNKNIPAIKSCIEAICKQYGERKINKELGGAEYYIFPRPEVLAQARCEDLRQCKTGYRDQYIIRAAQAVASGKLDLDSLIKCSHEEAVETLKSIHGVGIKVANCVSLYGLHHIEAFPVDVWIKKILKEIYQDKFDLNAYHGFAGIVQQYMFYYIRSNLIS